MRGFSVEGHRITGDGDGSSDLTQSDTISPKNPGESIYIAKNVQINFMHQKQMSVSKIRYRNRNYVNIHNSQL